jgi:hypothetical protein
MLTTAKTFQMLENESLWQTAQRVHQILESKGIPHAIAGGVAVSLHGYRRNTVDVDLVIRPVDMQPVRMALEAAGYLWDEKVREFRSAGGVAVQFLIAGEPAGAGSSVKLPDPAAEEVTKLAEGLPVLTLARLVESKIAAGEGNMRRAYKDFADVVELIVIHQLDGSFARFLHRSVRKPFRELVRRAQSEG